MSAEGETGELVVTMALLHSINPIHLEKSLKSSASKGLDGEDKAEE